MGQHINCTMPIFPILSKKKSSTVCQDYMLIIPYSFFLLYLKKLSTERRPTYWLYQTLPSHGLLEKTYHWVDMATY